MSSCIIDTTLDEVKDSWEAACRGAALAAIDMEKIDGEIVVVLTDNEYIKKLNSEFRGIDDPTDVLSFPINDFEGLLKNALADGFEPEEGEEAAAALGDIYISVERAAEQGAEFGNTTEEELAFLTVHGALHLMGYDHMTEEDELLMRSMQRKALGREEK